MAANDAPQDPRKRHNATDDAMDAANNTIDQMMDEINKSLGSMNFSLGNTAFNGVLNGLDQASRALNDGLTAAGRSVAKWLNSLDKSSPYERYLAPLTVTTGPSARGALVFIFAFVIIIPLIICTILSIVSANFTVAIIAGILLAITGYVFSKTARKGMFESKLANMYTMCRSRLVREPVISIQALAVEVGTTEEDMTTYLKEFVGRDWAPQGHISSDGTTFLLTNELFDEYERRRREEEAVRGPEDKLTPEQRETLDKIHENMDVLSMVSKTLEGEAYSDVEQTIKLAQQIETEARRHPDTIAKLGMFSTYYLPTTTKLIGAYAEISAKPSPSANEREVAARILGSLKQINEAFQTLLDSMSSTRTLDIESDLEAMQTMLRQDGLSK